MSIVADHPSPPSAPYIEAEVSGAASSTSPSRQRKRRDIQGLRAVAVLLVVAYHAGLPIPGGFFGVDVFFAISGFVITSMLTAELTQSGRLRLGNFYGRRIRRLLPALAVLLIFVALVGTLASPVGGQRIGAVTGIWASLFSANLYLGSLHTGYFDPSVTLDPLLHTWTLAVEEQFYVVFPLMLLLSWRLGRLVSERVRRGFAIVAVASAGLASLWLMETTSAGHTVLGRGGGQFAFYSASTRAWEFAAGALLALLVPYLQRLPLLLASALGAAGLGLIALAAAPTAAGDTGFRPQAALLAVAGACALLLAGLSSANSVSGLLSTKPLVWIGDLSYSWYLWHWPLIVFASALLPDRRGVAVLAAGASLLPAWLSYRFVEAPIRFSPRIGGRWLPALAVVCIAAPVAAAFVALGTHHVLERTSAFRSWNRVERLHADGVLGCNSQTPLGERPPGRCEWKVPHPRGRVVLVGDSNAGHFTEPFVRAARHARYDATVATLWSCPFVKLRVEPGLGTFHKTCSRFVDGTLATLVRERPSLVIMAARSDDYVESSDTGLGPPGSASSTHDPAAKARLWEQGVHAVATTLSRAGVRVVLVHPVPALPATGNDSAVLRILLRASPTSVSRASVDRQLRRARLAESAALANIRHASTIDFEDVVCGRTRCSSARGHRFLYRDRTHLSVDGALTLTPRFYRLLLGRARRRTR